MSKILRLLSCASTKTIVMERIRIKDIAKLAQVSVGTVDRVLHGRSGVSEASRKRVEEILERLHYRPNMYASALASNRCYAFDCLLPQHDDGEYWTEVQQGIQQAVQSYSDFNIDVRISYYDPFDYRSFAQAAAAILERKPDGVLFAPTAPAYSKPFTDELGQQHIPYIYIDSNIPEEPALSFFGQNSYQSGYFAARMLMLLEGGQAQEVAIFRKINEGIVGSNQQERREIGFRTYMSQHHPSCTIWELDLHAKRNSEDTRMLDQFFAEHPHIASGITFNSKAHIVGDFLLRTNRRGVQIMGYDMVEKNANCVKLGSISFLIAQHGYMQGYSCIESLFEAIVLKKKVNPVNYVPIELLTKENVDFYRRTQL